MDPLERLYLDALAESAPRPRGSLRLTVLAGARASRRPVPRTTPWAAPYASRVAAMDAVLAEAADDDWSRIIVEGWTLQELVAHLAAKDGLVAAQVGAPVLGPPITAGDSLGRTAEVQAHERGRSPVETRRAWRDQADALCRHLIEVDPATPVTLDSVPVPITDQMLARSLETWIHADDAAQVAGLTMPSPVADQLHPMADLCARLLPWTMLVSGIDGTGRTVRVTLTGPGGGHWLVPLGVADAPGPREDADTPAEAHITADVRAFCFLLGGRGAPETFPADIAGDLDLARQVLQTAPALSGP
jgi:uncharacterized protein (TIGR03083 family)